MSRPRVSVVIPTFQSELRIGSTLSRLKRQTFTDFEIIVVNDGSTDQTSDIVTGLMKSDPRIRLLEQAGKGIAAARNLGIDAARGDAVAFLDDDDLWHPTKLELQVARLDSIPTAAVVSCFSALVDPGGRLLGWRWGGTTEGDVYREMLEWDMISGGSVALVARRALEEAGGFDSSLPDRADWDLWIRLARVHPFTCVPRALVGYTRRTGSVSQSYDRMIAQGRDVLMKARAADPEIRETEYRSFLARDLFGAACLCLVDGKESMAWQYLSRSLREAPGIILGRPRRWGLMMMLTLSTVLPQPVYRDLALAAMSRAMFRMQAGAQFDSLV
ncbi:MAG TPA: glycosyltransferase family 2 protein [Gemmatimonadaceae bacterium]|nr:glycosyltransferase family 2 protein [Gemmatimonadaceae bacterium]